MKSLLSEMNACKTVKQCIEVATQDTYDEVEEATGQRRAASASRADGWTRQMRGLIGLYRTMTDAAAGPGTESTIDCREPRARIEALRKR